MVDIGGGFAPSITPVRGPGGGAPRGLGGILELAGRSVPYRELASRLEDRQRIAVTDATAGARAFAWAALVAENARPGAPLAPGGEPARRRRAELARWVREGPGLALPPRETMSLQTSAP